MGKKIPLTCYQQYAQLLKELKKLSHITYVVAVDFSESNRSMADGWGAPEFGPGGNLHGNNGEIPS